MHDTPAATVIELHVTVLRDAVWCKRCLTSAAHRAVAWTWGSGGPTAVARMTICERCDA